jgi:hypothetical protein
MKRKCKTCGRPVGKYGYGGDSWYHTFEQKVGKVSKDKWLQATSQFNPLYNEHAKKIWWTYPKNENAQALFCRQMCVNTYLEQFNEAIARLPNLINV